MTINRIAQPPDVSGLSLDAFSEAARTGDSVQVSVDGRSLQVLGTGTTPGGRSVAWVAPDADTASLFTQALGQTYGHGVAALVARELSLTPGPGKPLSAHTIERAVDLAQTKRSVMDGIDFVTQLGFSAHSKGADFLAVCRQAGVPSDSLDTAARQRIDAAMQQKFDQAHQSETQPVDPATARGWLRELLAQPQ
jgi:hypothetical protein